MSAAIHCDGCGAEMHSGFASAQKVRRLIHGHRDGHSGQGLHPIPDAEFDWCENCARIAFTAVRAARGLACRFCGTTLGLETIHLDGDPLNNDPETLDVRCNRHRHTRSMATRNGKEGQ